RPMDATIVNLAIYLTATFAAALVTGVAGFAFGLVAAAIWLHILTPIQTATLIIAFRLVVQGVSVWKLPRAVRLRRVLAVLFPVGPLVSLWALRFSTGPGLTMFVPRSARCLYSTAFTASPGQ